MSYEIRANEASYTLDELEQFHPAGYQTAITSLIEVFEGCYWDEMYYKRFETFMLEHGQKELTPLDNQNGKQFLAQGTLIVPESLRSRWSVSYNLELEKAMLQWLPSGTLLAVFPGHEYCKPLPMTEMDLLIDYYWKLLRDFSREAFTEVATWRDLSNLHAYARDMGATFDNAGRFLGF